MQVRSLVSLVEEFPGIAVEFCHAQEAVRLIILRRVGERGAPEVHLEALIFQAGRLLEDVVPRQFVPGLLEDMGDRLRDDVAAQSHEVAGSRVRHPFLHEGGIFHDVRIAGPRRIARLLGELRGVEPSRVLKSGGLEHGFHRV
jgi:hypothetical protein